MSAGQSDYRETSSNYEADKGWVILEALPRIVSRWGDCNYNTSLTARESHVEKIEKISESFEHRKSQHRAQPGRPV